MPKRQQHIVTIEKMIPGGFGLGRLTDGMVFLVRYVLPGERVKVVSTRRKKSYITARLEEVLERSPARVEPRCPVYGLCGGCDLQHADIAAQRYLKQQILKENLARGWAVGFKKIREVMAAILPSPNDYGYRQRIRLHVDKQGRMGFYRFESKALAPVSACPLAGPETNAVLQRLYASGPMSGLLKQTAAVELLFNPDRGKVFILLHFNRPPRPADQARALAVQDSISEVEGLLMYVKGYGFAGPFGKEAPPAGASLLRFTLPQSITGRRDLLFTWEVGGFCQVNLEQNKKLISRVLAWARPGPRDRVLDLYCGMGNFALPLSLSAREVVGLDGQGSAIRSANRNATLAADDMPDNRLPSCRFVKTSVPAGVKMLAAAGEVFDIVVLDPPRQGAAAIIPYLADFGAGRIIYISCDSATLARDLALLAGCGYAVRRIMSVDMFPQSHHL